MHVADANPLVAQLTHRPFPEVAEVLRSESGAITAAWDAAVREAMPQMRHLTPDQLRDSTPLILDAIADALAPIAFQTAKLLGAELAVESSSAAGSTLRLYLPALSHGLDNGAERAGL